MTRPAPQPNRIEWPTAPTSTPLWSLHPAPGDIRVRHRPGATGLLELVADPFSS